MYLFLLNPYRFVSCLLGTPLTLFDSISKQFRLSGALRYLRYSRRPSRGRRQSTVEREALPSSNPLTGSRIMT